MKVFCRAALGAVTALLWVMCTQSSATDVCERVCYVGIDFGTTGTAFGVWCNDSEDIQNGMTTDDLKNKLPTAVLLDSGYFARAKCDSPARSFGKYAINEHENDSEEVWFSWGFELFREFKMGLHKTDHGEAAAVSMSGRLSCPITKLIVQALAQVKTLVMEHSEVSKAKARLICVVTVPAVWRLAAKAIMRNAALKANLCAEEDLMIAHEPEVAALEVARQATEDKLELGAGEKIMVVDCGGGTVDITVATINPSDPLRISPHASPEGDAWGSTAVDKAFAKWFEMDFLGKDAFKKMKEMSNGKKWEDIKDGWETLKLGYEHKKDEKKYLKLDYILDSSFKAGALAVLVKDYNFKARQSLRNFRVPEDEVGCMEPCWNVIELPQHLIDKFHNVVVPNITHTVTALAAEHKVSNVFLVGGFAKSIVLQHSLRNASLATGGWNVRTLDFPQFAVMRGAVRHAKQRRTDREFVDVTHHYLRESYGTRHCTRRDDDDNEEGWYSWATSFIWEQNRWQNCGSMSSLVVAGTRIEHGETFSHSFLCHHEGHAVVQLYAWTKGTDGSILSSEQLKQLMVGEVKLQCEKQTSFEVSFEFGDLLTTQTTRTKNKKSDDVKGEQLSYNYQIF